MQRVPHIVRCPLGLLTVPLIIAVQGCQPPGDTALQERASAAPPAVIRRRPIRSHTGTPGSATSGVHGQAAPRPGSIKSPPTRRVAEFTVGDSVFFATGNRQQVSSAEYLDLSFNSTPELHRQQKVAFELHEQHDYSFKPVTRITFSTGNGGSITAAVQCEIERRRYLYRATGSGALTENAFLRLLRSKTLSFTLDNEDDIFVLPQAQMEPLRKVAAAFRSQSRTL
jgi:hypothetical protein